MKTTDLFAVKTLACTLFLLSFVSNSAMSQDSLSSIKRYTQVPVGYLMVLRQGDDVLAQIENLAKKEKIPSANFSGMGFVNAKFGFFNFETKQYEPKEFKDVELASLTGSIAWQENKVSLHTHGVVTDKNFVAHGGHLLEATVGTGSVEILVTVHDKQFERIMEQPLGANVLNIDQP